MIPSPGRVVQYVMAAGDVAQAVDASAKLNRPSEGDVLPAMIIRVWGEVDETAPCNLQVFLDGNASYWATSRKQGPADDPQPGQWFEPPRVG